MSNLDNIVVLGHSGFIGSRLISTLNSSYPNLKIIGLSRRELDLTKHEAVEKLGHFFTPRSIVVLCSGIKKQHGDSLEIFHQNINMVSNFCAALIKYPVSRVIYLSSAEVYGAEVNNEEIREDTPVSPTSYYGIAKFTSEGLLQKTLEESKDIDLTILRPATVYGPNEQENFYGPSGFTERALANQEIILWGDGSELREFVFIDDLIAIILQVSFEQIKGIFNVASGISQSFRDIINLTEEIISRPVSVSSRERSRLKVNQCFNNEKLKKIIPHITFTPLSDGLSQIIDAKGKK